VNRLSGESSPYLRQHQDNPVDWYPWGPEAFAAAREHDRPILLSVGYSACHWCHVMAHECFEDLEVAARMNDLFVNVKVDREERPDVDSVYMDAVQAVSGRGGWPMTVFCDTEGRPFFGGTYFPKPQFLQLLTAVDDAWRNRREGLAQQAGELTEALGRTGRMTSSGAVPGVETLNTALEGLAAQFDSVWGGFGRAPKFPQSMSLELCLRTHATTGSDDALAVVTTSLDAMASGGMYDHLGGGFARYSVDDHWMVPHFEKMLYDQALLARVYLHAFQVTREPRYAQVAAETIEYVLRDLRHRDGGFFSAEDADSPDGHGHNHEGLFYVWTPAEIVSAAGDELGPLAIEWYGVTDVGNFEGANILHRPVRGDLLRPRQIEAARALLFAARTHRLRPGLDDKVLTEWNALFLATLAEAALALGRDDWLAAAATNAEFLCASLRRADGRWLRSWQADSGARHLAFAADHAALIDAFTRLAEATGEARWITEATRTADALLDGFWDAGAGGVFTTGVDGEALVVRQKDLFDNATPSANSLAALALLRLAALTGEQRYRHHAEQILALVGDLAAQHPTAFAQALSAIAVLRAGLTEIAVVGPRPDLVRTVAARYLPNAVLTWGEPFASPLWEGRAEGHAYVCRDFICLVPVTEPEALDAQLSS
jgi:uncharacterized protein YyaL (SSP411 family)